MVAADTRAMVGAWISPERCVKIWTTPRGVAGITGNYSPIDAFREWTFGTRKKPRPKVGAETWLLEFEADGVFVTESDWTFRQPLSTRGFYAWGSGRSPALGALFCGADARRAVEVALLVDNESGGDITVLSVAGDDND